MSAFLVCTACFKLSLESPSQDYLKERRADSCLIDSDTLSIRASQQLEEGPAQDLAAGKRLLEELLPTNAASAEQWAAYGSVLVATGDREQGRYCYLRAAHLAPNSVETMLSMVNFFINTDQPRSALPYLGRILSHTSEYDSTVFNYLGISKLDFNEIVANGGIPEQLRPAQSYFRHLLETKDLQNARKAWVWMQSLSPDDQLAGTYVNFLLAERLTEEAMTAWTAQLRNREPGYGKSALIFNGDFEHDPTGTLFDWQISTDPHAHVNRDDQVAHSGRSSLRIDFDGQENLNYQGVSQRVFLKPGTYRLEVFVRTEGISTHEGVGLRVFNVETARLTGTNPWKRLEATLVVAPVTIPVEVQVVRHSSLLFDSHIAGTAWIDSVSLTRVH